MFNSAEEKLRALAAVNPAMQGYFGSGPFRWFGVQLQPGYASAGTCLRIRRVSAVYLYSQEGILSLEQVRFQIDVLDQDETTSRQALTAVNQFIAGVDLMSDAQFTSPPTTPTQFANWKLSERGPLPEVQASLQLWVWSADWRVSNNTNIS